MFKHEIVTAEIARKVQCRQRPEYCKFTTLDGKHSCYLIEKYVPEAERIKNFEVFEDDVWLISSAKTGTTWSQEMVWLIANGLDFETAINTDNEDRFPFIEFTSVIQRDFPFDSLTKVTNLPRPRFIKSHLPKAFLPDQLWTKKPKIIYITRNPKDTAISYFHHYRHIEGYFGTKEDFFEAFMYGCVAWGPFIPHTLEFWKMRNEENILYLNYEDMQEDLRSVIVRTAEFLGKSLTPDETNALIKHLSFNNMKNIKNVNKDSLVKACTSLNEKYAAEHNLKVDPENGSFSFIRKGISRAYETEMSPEWNAKFDKWIADSLKGTDLKFKF